MSTPGQMPREIPDILAELAARLGEPDIGPHYSGPLSGRFWARVNQLKDRRGELYSCPCGRATRRPRRASAACRCGRAFSFRTVRFLALGVRKKLEHFRFHFLQQHAAWDAVYVPETTWYGDVYLRGLTDEDYKVSSSASARRSICTRARARHRAHADRSTG